MATDLPIRCACGKLEGTAKDVSAKSGNHVICYCEDCQLFQHFLGTADAVLDANGGTRIFQMSPGRFEITSGREHLACMRLRANGIVRWYAGCCNTPLGNTAATPKMPFVGVITRCLPDVDARQPERTLGPFKCGVNGRSALGNREQLDAHDSAPASLFFDFLVKILRWRLRGDHKRTPFFDADSGEPMVAPKVLNSDELTELKRRREQTLAQQA